MKGAEMKGQVMTLAELRDRIGQEVGVSRWFTIDQARIDAFAEVTEDHQFLHVDPEAAAETPFGGTIAHGFLTLSMLSAMAYDAQPNLTGTRMGVNYGFEKIRFVSPVPSGARIRARFILDAVADIRPGEVQITNTVTVEVEGQEKPAIVAVWLGRRYMEVA